MAETRLLVWGLSALTDGHIGLYANLSQLNYRCRILFQTSDRSPLNSAGVELCKVAGGPIWGFLFFLWLAIRFRPRIIELYLHQYSLMGVLQEIVVSMCAWLIASEVTVVCTGREILNWTTHPLLKRLSVKLALAISKRYVIKEAYMIGNIQKYAIANAAEACFIHNGVIREFENIPPTIEHLGKNVLFFNSFKGFRNVDYLIEAFVALATQKKNVALYLVGARNRSEYDFAQGKIDELCTTKEIRERIHIHFMNDNRLFYYRLADVFVLPADIVWLNNSPLEAMLAGIPVLLPDVEWVDKIVEDGESGFIHKHKDVKDFVDKLTRVIELTDQERERIAAAEKKRIREFFSAEKRAILHHVFYRNLGRELDNECRQLFSSEGKVHPLPMTDLEKVLRHKHQEIPSEWWAQ